MSDEKKPIGQVFIAGAAVAVEQSDGQWMCQSFHKWSEAATNEQARTCGFLARSRQELIAHGVEAHGWLKPEACEHPAFGARVDVARLLDSGKFMAEIEVACSACGLPFRFVGIPAGLNFSQPMVSILGDELRAPIEPAYENELKATAAFTMPEIPVRH